MSLRCFTMLMLMLMAVASFLSSCCATCADDSSSGAQKIVDEALKRHPEVVRLTIHAVPQGESQMRGVASNSAAKLGKPSDPEDLRTLQTGAEVVLQEGDHIDVTLPLTDANGTRIATAGVTLANPKGRTRDELVADARAIAAELGAAIRAAPKPLW